MKFSLSCLTGTLFVSLTVCASAQVYPTRPIVMVVPVPAGGVMDASARQIAKRLGENLGQPIVIENKPGAGGIIGTEYVVRAKPDGYTILYNSHAVLVTYPILYKDLSFDPQTALAPIRLLTETPTILMVNANSPYKTLADFIEHAKKNPGKINYAHVGAGSMHQLVGELLQTEANIKMTAIPYKGAAPTITDLLAGTIDMIFDFPLTMKPLIEAGKLRPLAMTGSQRLSLLPNIPTFAELGYPSMDLTVNSVIVAPSDVPAPIIKTLSDALGKVLTDPAQAAFVAEAGAKIVNLDKDNMASWLEAKKNKEKGIMERAGIRPE